MTPRWESFESLRRLAVTCGGVREGELCLLVSDSAADPEVEAALGAVLRSLGARVVSVRAEPVELPGDELPEPVGAAMLHADVIFELTSVFAGSSEARRTACANGARYLTMPGLGWTTLRPGGPFAADFATLGEHAKRLAAMIDDAREFHLTSALGT